MRLRAPLFSLHSRSDEPSRSGPYRHRHRRVRCRSGAPIRSGEGYEPIIVCRAAFISFQTAAELRYGALRRRWGEARMRELESRIGVAETVHTGPELILTYAQLRADCARIGHALAQREHDADRWVAATAVRLGIPLVSNDGIFDNVPGLVVETARE